METKPLLHWH